MYNKQKTLLLCLWLMLVGVLYTCAPLPNVNLNLGLLGASKCERGTFSQGSTLQQSIGRTKVSLVCSYIYNTRLVVGIQWSINSPDTFASTLGFTEVNMSYGISDILHSTNSMWIDTKTSVMYHDCSLKSMNDAVWKTITYCGWMQLSKADPWTLVSDSVISQIQMTNGVLCPDKIYQTLS